MPIFGWKYMNELMFLQILIVSCLFFYAIKPLVRRFQYIKGMYYMPLFSLVLLALVFLIKGFQAQLLPLILFALLQALASLPTLVRMARGLKVDNWLDVSSLWVVFKLMVLAAFASFAFMLAPRSDAAPEGFSRAPYVLPLSNSELAGLESGEFRLYPPPRSAAGKDDVLILLLPPALGSFSVVDKSARDLAKAGYWVAGFSNFALDFLAADAEGQSKWPDLGELFPLIAYSLSGPDTPLARWLWQGQQARRSVLLEEAYAWLKGQIAQGWPALEQGPESFKPLRLVLMSFGENAGASLAFSNKKARNEKARNEKARLTALAMGEEAGQAELDGWAEQEALPLVASLFVEPHIFQEAGTEAGKGPEDYAAKIPHLWLVSDKTFAHLGRGRRLASLKNWAEDIQTPSFLFALEKTLPSDLGALASVSPVVAKIFNRAIGASPTALPMASPPALPTASSTALPTAAPWPKIVVSWLDLVLYGFEPEPSTWAQTSILSNKYWNYPSFPGILGPND